MAIVQLQSVGDRIALRVQSLEATLKEKAPDICSLFNKPYPQTWLALVVKSKKFIQPTSQPFLEAMDEDTYIVVFLKNDFLKLSFFSRSEVKFLMVQRYMTLHEVQMPLCEAFHQRVQSMTATLRLARVLYMDLEDMPFLAHDEEGPRRVDVEFQLSCEMDYWRGFYREVDRPRQPSRDDIFES